MTSRNLNPLSAVMAHFKQAPSVPSGQLPQQSWWSVIGGLNVALHQLVGGAVRRTEGATDTHVFKIGQTL
jgi:hypothetical protein